MFRTLPRCFRRFICLYLVIYDSLIAKIGKRENGYISAVRGKAMCGCSIRANQKQMKKERRIMSNSNSNKIMVPNAREAMNKFKMEAASDLAVAAPS